MERAKSSATSSLSSSTSSPTACSSEAGRENAHLAVLGSIAVALALLSIADVVYLKATEDDRWIEQSEQSCRTMLALSGGGSSPEKMTARDVGEVAGTPSVKVTGGTFANRPVLCVNHINSDGNTVSASHIFNADTGERVT